MKKMMIISLLLTIGMAGQAMTKTDDDPQKPIKKTETPAKKTAEADKKIQDVAETTPDYPGGMQQLFAFIIKNMKYPEEAKKQGICGRVLVQFVVEKDGSLSDIHSIRSPHPLLEAEALRILQLDNMEKWIPGTIKGKPVRVKMTVPIQFSLN